MCLSNTLALHFSSMYSMTVVIEHAKCSTPYAILLFLIYFLIQILLRNDPVAKLYAFQNCGDSTTSHQHPKIKHKNSPIGCFHWLRAGQNARKYKIRSTTCIFNEKYFLYLNTLISTSYKYFLEWLLKVNGA